MAAYQPNGHTRGIRRRIERARELAVNNEWQEAVDLNREILAEVPRDVDSWNRLGKALTELGRYDEAIEAYNEALNIEPDNPIAHRNVARLQQLAAAGVTPLQRPTGRPSLRIGTFVQEVGKTYVTDLVRPGTPEILARVSPGDEVRLEAEPNQVLVLDREGNRLGYLEPRIAQRLIQLIDVGNRYEAYVLGRNGATIRVILREVYRNPEAPAGLTFPRQAKIAAPRPYVRESARRLEELEPGLLLEGEDEAEEDEEDDEEEDLEGLTGDDDEAEETEEVETVDDIDNGSSLIR